jgi:hypothetical protein
MMKRDMDLIRQFLLDIEGGSSDFDFGLNRLVSGEGAEERCAREEIAQHKRYNFVLAIDSGLIDALRFVDGSFQVKKLTWAGHDFIDSVRDEKTWAKTKQGALAAGGWTLDILKDLAKGFIKKQLEEQTGIKL